MEASDSVIWPEDAYQATGEPEAFLMFDGATCRVPPAMAHRERDPLQLVGTVREAFAELCGRVCYDSLGAGKPSAEYHNHIKEIGHLNIYEGCVATFLVRCGEQMPQFAMACANRPGVWTRASSQGLRVTMNARACLEWDRFTTFDMPWNTVLGWRLQREWHRLMPQVVSEVACDFGRYDVPVMQVEPNHDTERWVSLWLLMNRGGSHEQVRHRWQCHVSQRSTRYCDENDGPRIKHPLNRHLETLGIEATTYDATGARVPFNDAISKVYMETSAKLKKNWPWPEVTGTSKTKQIRGACREYLEHQLATQMVFGASLEAWKWMIKERGSEFADAHIRELYSGPVQRELKKSRYAVSCTSEYQ